MIYSPSWQCWKNHKILILLTCKTKKVGWGNLELGECEQKEQHFFLYAMFILVAKRLLHWHISGTFFV